VGQVAEAGGARGNHVVRDVEVLVVDPDGRVQAERHLGDPLPEPRGASEPAGEVIRELVDPRGLYPLGGPERRRPADMHVCARILNRQEGIVERRKSSAHDPTPPPRCFPESSFYPWPLNRKTTPGKRRFGKRRSLRLFRAQKANKLPGSTSRSGKTI